MTQFPSIEPFSGERNPFSDSFRAKLNGMAESVYRFQSIESDLMRVISEVDDFIPPRGGEGIQDSGRITEVGAGAVNVQYRAESLDGKWVTSGLQSPEYRSFAPSDVNFLPAAVGARCKLWIDPAETNPASKVRLYIVFERPEVGSCESAASGSTASTGRGVAMLMPIARMAMLA